jgi:hypothetical protein
MPGTGRRSQDTIDAGLLGSTSDCAASCGPLLAPAVKGCRALTSTDAESCASTVAALIFCTWLRLSSVSSATCALPN